MVLERRGRQRLAGGRLIVEEGFFYFVFFVDFLIFEAIYPSIVLVGIWSPCCLNFMMTC